MKYQFGPSGGVLDNKFSYDTSKEHGDDVVRISQVNVKAGSRIDQIQIVWKDIKGGTITSQGIPPGATGGQEYPPFVINDGEHLTGIMGTLDGDRDDLSLRVYTLQFFTEISQSQVYPEKPAHPEVEHYFYFQCPPGYQIIDLFGWANTELDSLGVYVAQIST